MAAGTLGSDRIHTEMVSADALTGAVGGISQRNEIHFVSLNDAGGSLKPSREVRRTIQSHAVKRGLEKRRKLRATVGGNFCVTTPESYSEVAKHRFSSAECRRSPRARVPRGIVEPFQTLPVDSSRLRVLLGNYKARQAIEPVFSVAEELAFQGFRAVFRTGLDDPALASAVMLTVAFAATERVITRECLTYQSQAISHVRNRMNSIDGATSTATIGAILLLAGVEARLGSQTQVALHMRAVHYLLGVCAAEGIPLTHGIKRAIFWQDLNSSFMTGSNRIVSHTTFPELEWSRHPFSPDYFQLAPGFKSRAHLFTAELIEIFEDVHGLQRIRESSSFTDRTMLSMAYINNHQASIQSRLFDMKGLPPLMRCFCLAMYLCSSMLCCTVWCASVIPSHVSSRLLLELQLLNDDTIWDDHPDLLLWLLYTGGAFAPADATRAAYIELIHANAGSKFRSLHTTWHSMIDLLKQFVWADEAFLSPMKSFWTEARSRQPAPTTGSTHVTEPSQSLFKYD